VALLAAAYFFWPRTFFRYFIAYSSCAAMRSAACRDMAERLEP
jgi:hypothetical protein